MSLLSLEQINKSFLLGGKSLQVLFNINLTLESGDFLAILGPSGSGKSTLMNILGCMDKADSGAYFLHDQPVHLANDAQQTHIRSESIGFIFQKYNLIPQYTVLQNVILPLLIRGIPKKTAIALAKEKLNLLGMGERLTHKPGALSGGQQQRASIARALVGNPALLLADEPTGALDSKTGQDVLALFGELHNQGHSIIMITHDRNVAKKASRTVQIIDGHLS